MNNLSRKTPALSRADLLFSTGLALLLTHEMDAMTHAEWRILPLTSWMPEATGMFYFVIAHVPVFAVLLWLIASTSAVIRWRAQLSVSAFLIIHSILHTLFSGHEHYHFDGLLSLVLIYGAAVFGFLHCLLLFKNKPA